MHFSKFETLIFFHFYSFCHRIKNAQTISAKIGRKTEPPTPTMKQDVVPPYNKLFFHELLPYDSLPYVHPPSNVPWWIDSDLADYSVPISWIMSDCRFRMVYGIRTHIHIAVQPTSARYKPPIVHKTFAQTMHVRGYLCARNQLNRPKLDWECSVYCCGGVSFQKYKLPPQSGG